MHILTKDDMTALRAADSISVFKYKDTEGMRITKTVRMRGFASADSSRTIPMTIGYAGHRSNEVSCFAHESVYRYTMNPVKSIISFLRVGDSIQFQFCPDDHTNEYLRQAGLHGDVLRMYVTRGGKPYEFVFSTCISPDNSARMCKGAQYSLV